MEEVQVATGRRDPRELFHSVHYLNHNDARLRHLGAILDGMGLELAGKTVLELGAGVGDHSAFWIDRGATMTITEPRGENLALLRERYPNADVRKLDLDTETLNGETFDIVYAYGVLYHLADPAKAIADIARYSREYTFLETCVSYGEDALINPCSEDPDDVTQAASGLGCRPTRRWVFEELQSHFPHVYLPGTQPDHVEFPTDWSPRVAPGDGLVRAVFVAAKTVAPSPFLFTTLLEHQTVQKLVLDRPSSSGLVYVLRRLGIGVVLDVGANCGQFGLELRNDGFVGAILSFEPQAHAFALLRERCANDPLWTSWPIGLSEESAQATLKVSANSVSSSLLDLHERTIAAEPSTEVVTHEIIEVRRLDEMWAELSPIIGAQPILLKMDVQGAEPMVLAGAGVVLQSVDAILLEVSLVPVYAGEMVMVDMLAEMRRLGFYPVWLRPGWSHGVTGQVFQCDILFSRSPDVP